MRVVARLTGEGGESLSEVADIGECYLKDAGEAGGSRVASGGGGGTEVRLWI